MGSSLLYWFTRNNPRPIIDGWMISVAVHWAAGNPNAFRWKGNLPKVPLSMGRSRPPYNTWFLGTLWVHLPNAILIGPATFSRLTVRGDYTLLWGRSIPLGGSKPPSNAWLRGPPESTAQTACQSVQPFSHGSPMSWTYRQTDSPHYHRCSNMPQLCYAYHEGLIKTANSKCMNCRWLYDFKAKVVTN